VKVVPALADLQLDRFDYELPPDRVAQHPLPDRGASRLMVLDRARGTWAHSEFRRFPEWLNPGEVLVRNDARVMRARLRGQRPGGGELEVLLLRHEATEPLGEVWSCLVRPGRRIPQGDVASLRGGIQATWLDDAGGEGIRRVRLVAPRPIPEILEEVGEVPLPPYIRRAPTESDAEAYQTVYARSPVAVAAPTAGLHFTEAGLRAVAARGVEIVSLTLHVGAGTFLPVREEDVARHQMAPERVEIPGPTAKAVGAAKRTGRRVVVVGTTTARALEGLFPNSVTRACSGDVSLFVAPGHAFAVVDALLTNFHLPRSTLLMLVGAFAGLEFLLAAYREAVARGYRFYSYGDAMLIL
jgi:S-adenosylmethionine:tRNA ribosyltransferase-isomerase